MQGPDDLPAWLLKQNADLVAEPIAEIINSSFRESRLPRSWKEADIVPVPKQRIVKDVSKHLRPISLTPILSKVAEDYCIETTSFKFIIIYPRKISKNIDLRLREC
jgi:hypothetical protein